MLRYILPLKWYSDRILGTYTNVNALHLNESVLNGKSAHPQFAQERWVLVTSNETVKESKVGSQLLVKWET